MRHGCPGGDSPVHPPDVVPDMVGAAFGLLGPRPGDQAQMVAEQQPVEAPGHRQLEAAQGPRDRRIRGRLLVGAGLGAGPVRAHAEVPWLPYSGKPCGFVVQ